MTTERDIRNQIAFARDEGYELGIEKGAAQSRVEIAKALLAAGVDREIILRSTQVSEEQLDQF